MAKQALEAIGVETPIEVIPTGIPLPKSSEIDGETRARIRRQHGWSDHGPILLFAGRLAHEKNIEWLFDVLSVLLPEVPEIVLVLIGDGPDREHLEQKAAEMGIRDSVQFIGAVSKDQMNGFYAAADVFCFPSESETQGLVIGEARAAGLLTVVVNAGGAPETVEDGQDGYRITAGDTNQFANRVLSIIRSESERGRMREAALQRAKRFTPQRMIERVMTVYDTARSQPPRVKSIVPPFDGKASYWNMFSPR
jgi:glycosyltransferase involved in cell wall biosynthesis